MIEKFILRNQDLDLDLRRKAERIWKQVINIKLKLMIITIEMITQKREIEAKVKIKIQKVIEIEIITTISKTTILTDNYYRKELFKES